MTRDEFTRQLPDFANSELDIKPPLLFRGVSARVFPLRASLDVLQQLCDGLLNMVPDEAGRFRASLPYVFLVLLDYGRMSEAVARTGWFSQFEVYFGVPVEWYKRVGGEWIFHDWGVITPYIFVNDAVSVPTGRTVYGFPKVLADVDLVESRWLKNPVCPATVARIATTVFPKAFTGGDLETQMFLEIEKTESSNFRLPFDSKSRNMPWTMASNLADAMAGFGRDFLWMMQSMRIFPLNPFSNPNFLPQMLSQIPGWIAPGAPGFVVNSLNLKQFRRGSDPTKLCFQSLTSSCLQTTGFNRAGLLGEDCTLLGDLTGGYTLRLYQDSSLPIASALGLEVHSSSVVNGVDVSEFRPVAPFWLDVDLKYDKGRNVAWRTDEGVWRDGSGAKYHAPVEPGPDYNNSISSSVEAIAGPFQFTGTTIRVIPLLAKRAKLDDFLERCVNLALRDPIVLPDGVAGEAPAEVALELWSQPAQCVDGGSPIGGDRAYVYMVATSYGEVMSKSYNVGNWAKYELAFMIPVKWKRKKKDGQWEVMGVGMVPAFAFADNCITAITRWEIQGLTETTADFVRPESVWLGGEGGTNPEQMLLRMNAELLPALGAGQKAMMFPVLEIRKNEPHCGLGPAKDAAWEWAEYLREELERQKGAKQQWFAQLKVGRALALELLGNKTHFSLYTLKQFRDVVDPDKACYQALQRIPRVLSEVCDVREIEETISVRIYGYPTLNIVEELGLHHVRLEERAAGVVYGVQAIRPFYIDATMDEPLAERLMFRSGTRTWTMAASAADPKRAGAFETMLSEDAGAPRIVADRLAETLQDQMDPSRTSATMFQARNRLKNGGRKPGDEITVRDARDAFEHVDPKIIIDSVLSREWSNFDPNARWRQGRQTLLKGLLALPEGGPMKPYAEAELYFQLNNLLAFQPGSVAARIPGPFIPGAERQFLDLSGAPAARENLKKVFGREPSEDEVSLLLEIQQNLIGQGAAGRWRSQIWDLITNEAEFTNLRVHLEDSVNTLSPLAILGLDGLRQAYQRRNELEQDDPAPPPDEARLFAAGQTFLETIANIQNHPIVGEPSAQHNLDTLVEADHSRLKDMLDALTAELKSEIQPGDSDAVKLEKARAHTTEEGMLLSFARGYANVQFEALINKLSRAYQKPDYCIRRDSFTPADRDRLLPLSLSWNDDWYYGQMIALNQNLSLQLFKLDAAEGTDPK